MAKGYVKVVSCFVVSAVVTAVLLTGGPRMATSGEDQKKVAEDGKGQKSTNQVRHHYATGKDASKREGMVLIISEVDTSKNKKEYVHARLVRAPFTAKSNIAWKWLKDPTVVGPQIEGKNKVRVKVKGLEVPPPRDQFRVDDGLAIQILVSTDPAPKANIETTMSPILVELIDGDPCDYFK